MFGANDATGVCICRVVGTGNVAGVDVEVVRRNSFVYASEYKVCGAVSAPAIPPSLNDTLIVSPSLVVMTWSGFLSDDPGEEEESHCLSPSNVSLIVISSPSW